MISELEKRVQRYWTQRSHDFGTVRRNELEDEMGRKWFQELEKHLPDRKSTRLNSSHITPSRMPSSA